jgi:hypothetical protein
MTHPHVSGADALLDLVPRTPFSPFSPLRLAYLTWTYAFEFYVQILYRTRRKLHYACFW